MYIIFSEIIIFFMENPFKRLKPVEAEPPVLTPIEKFAQEIWATNGYVNIADLGQSGFGLNLNLSDEDREAFLAELKPALEKLGFM